MDISIVIPALNEANKVRFDVEAAALFLEKERMKGEVIVVDDGSTDGTSEEARKANLPGSVFLNIVRLEKNQGKGFAVKTGIMASKGDVVLFADSGTCVPYANALLQIKRIRSGDLDIAMASRRLRETVIRRNRSLKRRMLSWLFRQVAIALTGLPRRFTDTQCGFKVYRGDIARGLFKRCVTTGFIFELEILLRALKRSYRIEEFPVEWSCDLDTRLRPGSEAVGVFKELLRVRSIIEEERLDEEEQPSGKTS
ncbi:MAG: glycosyltransferase [Candidatus Aminicenantes bacterium]|nr:glycosyltransferase [Candidatus Aminicenantes bacterium]MDH5384082.1 glycosyltransferase [Candidatus Aminicenantes bacterium]MDH5742090.1 glycosyltransferase [Candidatus Aminicenantes bacterium]